MHCANQMSGMTRNSDSNNINDRGQATTQLQGHNVDFSMLPGGEITIFALILFVILYKICRLFC